VHNLSEIIRIYLRCQNLTSNWFSVFLFQKKKKRKKERKKEQVTRKRKGQATKPLHQQSTLCA
jgi:hypothetical protein